MTSTLIKPVTTPRLNAPTIQKLENGLTVVAEHLPVDAVNLSIWLNVGSCLEPDNINGMAHFLEHMMFKGTPRLKQGEFERLIEKRGAVTNAATSQDYTHYYITTAPKDFADLAPLQLDVVLNASIEDEAFDREKLVVLEEIRRSEDNPQRRTYQRSMELAFNQLPYRRPVLGPSEVIAGLKAQQMRDFHNEYYYPGNMIASVVGNLPVEDLIRIVSDATESVFPPEKTTNNHQNIYQKQVPKFLPEPPFSEIIRQEFEDENLQQARLVMIWRVPGLQTLDQTYALDVLATILGHGRTSRLVQDLRENQRLVTSINASNMSYFQQGVFSISAQLPEHNLALVEKEILAHIEKMQQELVTEGEIHRVQKQVANRFVFGNETPSDRANLYGYYQAIIGDLAPAFNYPSHIQALTQTDIQAASRQYLSPHAYGIVIIRPAK